MRQRNIDAVRLVLGDNPDGLYALQICRRTRMRVGTVYPVLAVLESAGEVEAVREPNGRRRYRRRSP